MKTTKVVINLISNQYFNSIDEKHHNDKIMSMFGLTIKIETLYNEL
jgi:cytoplasmic iron level regulating protein YaaA (DUF328/UPF0246 family)